MERNLLVPDNSRPPWIGDPRFQQQLRKIRWIVTDVDGVLTDGSIILDGETGETKAFSVRDGVGVWLAQQTGLELAVLTGRLKPVVARRARELGIVHVVGKPINQKRDGMLALQSECAFTPPETLYLGDDIIDLPVFPLAGITVAPSDADPLVLQHATACTRARGGRGVLREAVEAVLTAQGKFPAILNDRLGTDLTTPERAS